MKAKLRILLVFLIIVCFNSNLYAHRSKDRHAVEMLNVLGLLPIKGSPVYKWACYISSDMIDKAYKSEFYKNLKSDFPGFACKHRLLFHWAYDGKPWNMDIEERVLEYCEKYDRNQESLVRIFQSKFKDEQRRRNRHILLETCKIFGFAMGGKDRAYANSFAGIVYDTHIIGDYMTDNSDLDGLQKLSLVLRNLSNKVGAIDKTLSIPIKKKLLSFIHKAEMYESANNKQGVQNLADNVMSYIERSIPKLIRETQNGSIYRRLKSRNIAFIGDE